VKIYRIRAANRGIAAARAARKDHQGRAGGPEQHGDAPGLGAAATELAENIADIDGTHLRARHAGNFEHRHAAAPGAVGQGQLDTILNSSASERRGIIEEAAGILKFRKRKERAERRLVSTEGNLLRHLPAGHGLKLLRRLMF